MARPKDSRASSLASINHRRWDKQRGPHEYETWLINHPILSSLILCIVLAFVTISIGAVLAPNPLAISPLPVLPTVIFYGYLRALASDYCSWRESPKDRGIDHG